MPLTTCTGKKQTAMPGPNSAAYKKIVAARKTATAVKTAGHVTASRKRRQMVTAFSTLKSRQMTVERLKRAIWAKVAEINEAIIALALSGNYTAAKALFDFAGVYSLPIPADDHTAAVLVGAPVAEAPGEAIIANQVDLFFRSLGVEPPCDEPERGPAIGSVYAAL